MRNYKRFCALLLASIMIFSNLHITAYATDNTEIEIDTIEEKPEEFEGRLEGNAPAEFYGISSRAALGSIHAEKFNGYTIEKGVDVSYHNGTINWKKVKNDGIDFAIVRVGARSVSTGKMIYDYMSPENIENAQAAGLDVGVYIYSQAINKKEAVEEAKYILDKIKGYDLELPVVFDYEYYYEDNYKGRLQRSKMTDRQRTDVCHAFCETVEAAGYEAMIYANRSMLTDDLYVDELDDKYEIWLAEWASKSIYQNDYTYWQYSATGSVNGIPSKNVDMNYRYYLPEIAEFDATICTENSINLSWNAIEGAEGYNLYMKLEDGTYELISRNEGNTNTTFPHESLKQNTQYTYKLCYYYTNEAGEEVEVDSVYPELTKCTLVKLKRPVLTAEALDAGRIKLSWNKVEGADGYVIQQYYSSQNGYSTVKTINSPKQTSYTRSGMKINTKYQYRIKAFVNTPNGVVYSSNSSSKSVTTHSKLLKPVLTGESPSYSKVKIKWNKVYGAEGYQVQRYNASKKKYITLKTFTDADVLSYTSSGLSARTSYKYRVRAYATKSGNKIYSNYATPITVTTKARVNTPKLDVATKTYTSLNLKWDKISNATGYEIQRYNSSTKKYVTVKTIKDGKTTSYVDTYLNCESSYKYRVRAYTVSSGKKYYGYYSDAESAKTGKRRTGIVTAKTLNVRSGAGTTYKKILSLKKGSSVTVTGSRKGWYRVRVKVNESYKTGYVTKEYLELQ